MLRRPAADYEPAESYDSYEDSYDDAPRRGRRGGSKTTVVLGFFALAFLAVAVLRVFGIDGNQFTVPALALTPYIAPGGLLLALIAFALRRRILAVVVLLMAVSMAVLLMPRYFSDDQPGAKGQHLRLLSANVNKGRADSATIVRAVRDNKIDLLSLPELSQPEVVSLDDAGLAAELPYRVFDPGPAGTGDGSGIASRYPLRQIILSQDSTRSQPAAVVDLPGRDDIELVAVHIQAAIHGSAETWKRELANLPPPNPARVRVLAGDFNATLDHAAFRGVLDRGYSDAGEQTGNGLTATWSSWQFGPPITIDHVLVDHRCAVQGYAVWKIPGSDHNAVFAEFALP